MKSMKVNPSGKSARGGKAAAQILAAENWRERLEMNDGRPDDFLSFFTEAGVEALACAASDKTATAEERASAGYRLASISKIAAESLTKAFPSCASDMAAPDCGFIRAAVGVVDALHEAARMTPKAFRWMGHYQAWPVLIAPDRTILDRCWQPGNELFNASGLPQHQPKQGKGKRIRLGGMWAALASEMFYCASMGREGFRLTEPTGKRWQVWDAIREDMNLRRGYILSRPDVRLWANTNANARSKDYLVWSRLLAKTRRALKTLARG